MFHNKKTKRNNIKPHKMFTSKKKTLKSRINKYIYKYGDINTPDGLDKNKVIDDLIEMYKNGYTNDEYLDWLGNNLLFFIGYRIDLKENNNIEGLKIWDELAKRTKQNTTEEEYRKLLDELPLYYLLTFLGYSYYINLSPKS
jgi:hypothetical protein